MILLIPKIRTVFRSQQHPDSKYLRIFSTQTNHPHIDSVDSTRARNDTSIHRDRRSRFDAPQTIARTPLPTKSVFDIKGVSPRSKDLVHFTLAIFTFVKTWGLGAALGPKPVSRRLVPSDGRPRRGDSSLMGQNRRFQNFQSLANLHLSHHLFFRSQVINGKENRFRAFHPKLTGQKANALTTLLYSPRFRSLMYRPPLPKKKAGKILSPTARN